MTGDRRSECCTLCNLGNCFRATAQLEDALEYYTMVRLQEELKG